MQQLRDAIKAQAALVDRTLGQPRFATITSFNPTDYTARVSLQPEGTLSGWLPVLSPWAGPAWGIVCPLNTGDQVLVLPHEGDAEHGIIIGRAFSSRSPVPHTTAGEFCIVHSSGACLRLKADGTVSISGDLHVTGSIYDSHGSLAHLRATFNSHVHPAPPNGDTSPPRSTD